MNRLFFLYHDVPIIYIKSKSLFVIVLCLHMIVSPTTGLQCYECSDYLVTTSNPLFNGLFQSTNNECSLIESNLRTCSGQGGSNGSCYTTTTSVTSGYLGQQVSVVLAFRGCSSGGTNISDGCVQETVQSGITLPPSLSVIGASLNGHVGRNCFCSTDRCNNQKISIDNRNTCSLVKSSMILSSVTLIFSLLF